VIPRTVHEALADYVLDDILRDPKAATVLANARQDLRSGNVFDRDYVNMIGMPDRRAGVCLTEQVAAFLAVHAGVVTGRVATVQIDVGCNPDMDVERAINARALTALPSAFAATVNRSQFGDANGDGWLTWSDTILGERATEPYSIRTGFPAGVPIEIGSTKASVTLGHLYGGFWGVARWPYGSSSLTILLNTDVFVSPGSSPRNPMGL
jgi:hypothetical protein